MALEDIIRERREKAERLKSKGIELYPSETKKSSTVEVALASFEDWAGSKKEISLAGRIRGLRDQGKIAFIDLGDESGEMQIVVAEDNLAQYEDIIPNLDRGDFISVTGSLFVTKKGEKSLEAREVNLLVKSWRPLPTEHFGLEDVETRLRQRYLDLILNKETRNIFRAKARFWQAIRSYLLTKGFLEVETGILEATPGGAEAEPFVTHHNALNRDFYLRISLEIALKKIMVGGFEKIFEIGRVFRNEGIDAEHLQDYTQMEFYSAYADYNDLMDMTRDMYQRVIMETVGSLKIKRGEQEIDWGQDWPKIDYSEIFKEKSGLSVEASRGELFRKAVELGLKPDSFMGEGRLIDMIYKKTVRPTLVQPCFLIDTPVVIEPLAKRHRNKEGKVERFQIIAAGTELGKGFSEANDPVDQRERLEEQMKLREAGDKEAQILDEDFLEAMEYGMPPMAGFGLSERLFSILMDKPIRETTFFPLMKEKK